MSAAGAPPSAPPPPNVARPNVTPLSGTRVVQAAVPPEARRPRKIPLTGLEWIVYALWVVFLMDPQWWARVYVGEIATRIPTPFYFILGFAAILRPAKKGQWATPLLALTLLIALTTPFAVDIQRSIVVFRQILVLWLLAIGTLNIIDTPRRAVTLVFIVMLWQYLWWGLNGVHSGLVEWDYQNANYDGYGPLMASGIAAAVFMGLSIKTGKFKWLAYATAALSLIALMSSFARGAALSGIAVIGISWLRTPRKGAMTLGIVAGFVIVVALALTVFSNIDRGDANPNYLTEMSTIGGAVSDPDHDVEGTAQDREAIWEAARMLWVKHPVFGVGAEGFGHAAAQDFKVGELKSIYGEYPGALWSKALHNVYYQTLSELGTVGFIILMWLLYDFHRRNARLRSPPFREAWRLTTDGKIDLLPIANGLEGMMVAWLVCAYFYNVLFVPWLYGVLVLNLVLHNAVDPVVARMNAAPRRPAPPRFAR